jgi:hypothetical protein
MYPQQPPQQPPYGQQPGGYGPPPQGYATAPQPQKNGTATLAMWLSFASLITCGFAGIPALILGIKAKKEIDSQPGRFSNAAHALVAIIMGSIGTLFAVAALVGMVSGNKNNAAAINGESTRADHPAGEGPTPGVTVARTAAPKADPLAALPDDERAFCSVVSTFAKQYDDAKRSGANELKLSKLRTARKQALVESVGGNVTGWIGKIDELSTTNDGKAAVKVTLPCKGGTLTTWNNTFSDMTDHTLIPQASSVYDSLSDIGEGKTVSFGGSFIPNDKDGYHEGSMSEEGSLGDPEYLFRFAHVSAIK